MMNTVIPKPKAFETDDYRSLFRGQPAAVSIVTCSSDNGPVGFTATSVVSVSASPAVIMFSIMSSSSSWAALSQAESVVLHFLDAQDSGLAQRFATSGIDRFEGLEWTETSTGEPVLPTRGTWVRCEVLGHQEVGGSYLFQVTPTEVVANGEREPLLYVNRTFLTLGSVRQK